MKYEDYKVDIPVGQKGKWKVERFDITEEDAPDTLQGLKPRRFLVKQLRDCICNLEVVFPTEGYQCSPY